MLVHIGLVRSIFIACMITCHVNQFTENYLLFLDELKASLFQTLLARKNFKFFKTTVLTGLWRNPTRDIELMRISYNVVIPFMCAVRCPIYAWSY